MKIFSLSSSFFPQAFWVIRYDEGKCFRDKVGSSNQWFYRKSSTLLPTPKILTVFHDSLHVCTIYFNLTFIFFFCTHTHK